MQVLDVYHPLALRWFLVGTQYRSPVNYSKSQLENATDRVYYLFQVSVQIRQYLVIRFTLLLGAGFYFRSVLLRLCQTARSA